MKLLSDNSCPHLYKSMKKTIFNTQTNTCFTTGMVISPVISDNSETNSDKNLSSSVSYSSNGVKPLISTASKGSMSSTVNTNLDEDDNIVYPLFSDSVSDISQQVGVFGGVDYPISYDKLSKEFKVGSKRTMHRYDEKKIINLTLAQLKYKLLFVGALRDLTISNSVVYVKIVYTPNLVRMAGKQVIFSTHSIDAVLDLRLYIGKSISKQLEEYAFDQSRIKRIIVTIIPLKLNLINKYKVDSKNRMAIRDFIDANFSSKTIIPITVDPVLLGGELPKCIDNGKIVDLWYYVTTKYNSNPEFSLKDNFLIDPKLSNLSPNFKFYQVVLNNRSYILGIHYLTSNSVRKIRLSLSGLFLEDIVDTALINGNVKRVNGNNVLILKNGRVVHFYKKIKFPAIKNNSKNISSTENPNIGVIDFETFKSSEGFQKIYAGGFKSYLENKATMYYIEDVKNPDLSVLKLVNELLRSKYSKTTFYCHNLRCLGFIYLTKVLVDYNESNKDKYEVSFKYRDHFILSLIITKGGNRLTINDSYPILNSSLRDLAKSYECDSNKSYFPYKFSSEDNLFYIGNTPLKSYYDGISQTDYDKLYSDNWDFKSETLKYLELDLETLYEVLTKANKRFFLDYEVDMTKSHTIPGMFIKSYLSIYYKKKHT